MNAFLYGIAVTLFVLLGTFAWYWHRKAHAVSRKGKTLLQEIVSLLIHDLRGPLDNIQKMSELMLSSSSMTEERRKQYTGLIHDSSSAMLVLINNISDAAKLGAGTLVIKKMEGNLLQLIRDRISFFSLAVKNAGLTMRSSFGNEIPEAISFDSRVVSDTINILFSNAIKFNEPGGNIVLHVFRHRKGKDLVEEAKQSNIEWYPPTYSEGSEHDTDAVVIAVTHSDIGIPIETLPLLFKKYEKMGEAFLGKVKQAHGISLLVAKHLVRHAGGIIGAGSEENKGTTFFFTIPFS
ncbi:MAG: HAMP domain-containing sensor histidine kinase [bacterium]|nr:HAMP domain-containing sensor histidine kinase [bacterium]